MRGLTSLILLGSAALLASCSRSDQAKAPPSASSDAAAAEAPALWSVQALDDQNRTVRTILLCADHGVEASFTRPLPSPNGQPCGLIGPTVTNGGRFAARCKSEGRLFNIQAESSGDLGRDFTTRLLIQTDVKGQQSLVQTLHYRRLGGCPDGWSIGDAAAPGDTQTVNSLSGATRRLSAPVAAPPA